MEASDNRDEDYLKILAILHYVYGGIQIISIVVPLGMQLVMGAPIVGTGMGGYCMGGNCSPLVGFWFASLILMLIVLLGMIVGAMLILNGLFLLQRKYYWACVTFSVLECLFFPFGTILGILTFIVLMRPSVKTLFGIHPAPSV